jgi:hypothetical protein
MLGDKIPRRLLARNDSTLSFRPKGEIFSRQCVVLFLGSE